MYLTSRKISTAYLCPESSPDRILTGIATGYDSGSFLVLGLRWSRLANSPRW